MELEAPSAVGWLALVGCTAHGTGRPSGSKNSATSTVKQFADLADGPVKVCLPLLAALSSSNLEPVLWSLRKELHGRFRGSLLLFKFNLFACLMAGAWKEVLNSFIAA